MRIQLEYALSFAQPVATLKIPNWKFVLLLQTPMLRDVVPCCRTLRSFKDFCRKDSRISNPRLALVAMKPLLMSQTDLHALLM